jgi:hypothetical protein
MDENAARTLQREIEDLKATSERLKALADDTLTRSARVSHEVSMLITTNDPMEGRITKLDHLEGQPTKSDPLEGRLTKLRRK